MRTLNGAVRSGESAQWPSIPHSPDFVKDAAVPEMKRASSTEPGGVSAALQPPNGCPWLPPVTGAETVGLATSTPAPDTVASIVITTTAVAHPPVSLMASPH